MNNTLVSQQIEITNPAGLHARPAAVFASKAKTYQSDIRLIFGEQSANAKSVVGVMGLSTRKGDKVTIETSGSDAEQALAELTQLLLDRCGESEEEAPVVATIPAAPVQTETETMLTGVAASPGLAIGRVFHYALQEFTIEEYSRDSQKEKTQLTQALEEAKIQIEALIKAFPDPTKQAILSAHLELLQDPDLADLAQLGLVDGKTAAWAWRKAFSTYSARLESQGNALLRERANDIRDIGRRVLAILTGVKQTPLVIPEGAVLIAEDLTPSDTVALDPQKVRGFCTRTGGSTSHIAILARSLGIPAICGISQKALTLPDNEQVIIDGNNGTLCLAPNAQQIAEAEAEIDRISKRRIADNALAHKDAYTKDNVRIEVAVNIRNASDAEKARALGAEGVGLLRSEFLFEDRVTEPTEQEQAQEYCAIAKVFGKDRPVVIRTLDVGGDKPLSYLPLPKEDNPFLGLRGIRVGLARPELLRTQIRAILQATPFAQVHIMFPMIASFEELRAAKGILKEEQDKTGHNNIKVGITVEIPSAAIMAERFAQEVDFFSLGTNDLTQYTLAMDRGHPELAKHANALHPGVLAMIAMTCAGAQKHNKWVAVCGGLASEEIAIPLLVGLGVRELSVSTPVIASTKATLSRWTLAECQQLAKETLALVTTDDIREHLLKAVKNHSE